VIFGFLKDLIDFQDRFLPGAIALCFDKGPLNRERDYPAYKLARKLKYENASEEDKAFKEHFDEQVRELRTNYLKRLGYRNIFWQSGYEADDIIGWFCTSDKFSRVRKIIISSDKDYYQLLNNRTSIYSPGSKGRLVTQNWLTRFFGIEASQFIDAKALAGCKTDGIEGIQGVGIKTACKFLQGTLPPKTKAFKRIVEGNKIWERNRHLVKLPYPGVKPMVIRRDKVNATSWEQLAKQLGMKSIVDKHPGKKRKRGLGVYNA